MRETRRGFMAGFMAGFWAVLAVLLIVFVLFLLSVALYGCAALTAGIADRDVPLELLEADSVQDPDPLRELV